MDDQSKKTDHQVSSDDTRASRVGLTQEIPVVRREDLPFEQAGLVLLGHPDPSEVGKMWRLKVDVDGGSEIGRLSSCEVVLGGTAAVSRRHARIEAVNGSYYIQDLDSTNGTYVNGERLTAPACLQTGDRVQVGTVHLKFLVEADVEAAYHEMMYSLAVTDPLTHVANRRRFEEELRRECARAARYARPLGLLLVDIDRFKEINDAFGHPAADVLLKEFASALLSVVREEQTVARIGGDEFAVLIPEGGEGDCRHIAVRIQEAVGAIAIDHPKGKMRVRCSIGGAVTETDSSSASDLYETADAALYQSKHEGRNRVTIHGSR